MKNILALHQGLPFASMTATSFFLLIFTTCSSSSFIFFVLSQIYIFYHLKAYHPSKSSFSFLLVIFFLCVNGGCLFLPRYLHPLALLFHSFCFFSSSLATLSKEGGSVNTMIASYMLFTLYMLSDDPNHREFDFEFLIFLGSISRVS